MAAGFSVSEIFAILQGDGSNSLLPSPSSVDAASPQLVCWLTDERYSMT